MVNEVNNFIETNGILLEMNFTRDLLIKILSLIMETFGDFFLFLLNSLLSLGILLSTVL